MVLSIYLSIGVMLQYKYVQLAFDDLLIEYRFVEFFCFVIYDIYSETHLHNLTI